MKTKKLKLKPSQREKKRFLLLEKVDKDKVEKAILDYVGILGWAKASPMWVKSNILAVNRKELEKVKASLFFAKIRVKKISGTLKKLVKRD